MEISFCLWNGIQQTSIASPNSAACCLQLQVRNTTTCQNKCNLTCPYRKDEHTYSCNQAWAHRHRQTVHKRFFCTFPYIWNFTNQSCTSYILSSHIVCVQCINIIGMHGHRHTHKSQGQRNSAQLRQKRIWCWSQVKLYVFTTCSAFLRKRLLGVTPVPCSCQRCKDWNLTQSCYTWKPVLWIKGVDNHWIPVHTFRVTKLVMYHDITVNVILDHRLLVERLYWTRMGGGAQ